MSEPRHISGILKELMAGLSYECRDERVHCPKCGWTFTVHKIPLTPEYEGADWFCPHCGSGGLK